MTVNGSHTNEDSMAPSRSPSSATEISGLPPRLQKVLAQAGYGSRRACEELIRDGRVEIDRQVADELGVRVDLSKQQVRVDGEVVRQTKLEYLALHKPVGVVTTNRDPARRPRVIDLVPNGDKMFAVGRLDISSSGLILVTNDGEFSNRVAHPRYGIEKTYRVVVAGAPTRQALDTLRRGVHLAEGPVRVVSLKVKSQIKTRTTLDVVLDEGRNRELRRMFARIGHKVQSLQRIAIGPLKLADLPPGAHRPLSKEEVRKLLNLTESRSKPKSKRVGKPKPQSTRSVQSGSRRAKSPAPQTRGRRTSKKNTRRKKN